jgi:hypothetical protein
MAAKLTQICVPETCPWLKLNFHAAMIAQSPVIHLVPGPDIDIQSPGSKNMIKLPVSICGGGS